MNERIVARSAGNLNCPFGLFLLLQIFANFAFAAMPAEAFGPFQTVWKLGMHPGRIPDGYVLYPALPWFGIMACREPSSTKPTPSAPSLSRR